MTDALSHRGPDGQGTWIDGAVGLGHRRLAIRDLSEAGKQPVSGPGGWVTVTYNGEIYNSGELSRLLERDHGFVFRSHGDAEIIPAGYMAWGLDFFDKIEGMFAIGLWDARLQRLILVRDRIGIKPLFVFRSANTCRFASELKGILACDDVPRNLDLPAVHSYLAQGYASPGKSLLQNVVQVAPGTLLVLGRDGTKEERRFWQPRRSPSIFSLEEAVEAFETVWPDVVRDHLISDVPVGVLQSGGIDSSLVSMAASRIANPPLFTAIFDSKEHSEEPLARLMAEHLGAAFYTFPVDATHSVEERFRKVVHHMDGQVYDSSGFALHAIAEKVREHVTVVLSGEGGDEFFCGYHTYRASKVAEVVAPVFPNVVLNVLAGLSERLGRKAENRLSTWETLSRFCRGLTGAPGTWHAQWRRILPAHLAPMLYGRLLLPLANIDPLADYSQKLLEKNGSSLDRCLLADQMHYLPGDMLIKADAMTMAHGLELRVPLLDRRIMELSGSIDGSVLLKSSEPTKRVLRNVLQRFGAPPPLAQAPKAGFNIPVARLLRNQLAAWGELCFVNEPGTMESLFNTGVLCQLWRDHLEYRANHGHMLWCLLSLATWMREAGISEA
jgi:asparagine synthase (glutamine-hydrolysing)